jgi:LPXTG-site transpeptidase (sortase) family protein
MTGSRAYAGGRAGPRGRRPLLAAAFGVLLAAFLISRLVGGASPADGADAAPPQRIEIPAIGVSARVAPLGLDGTGALAAPTSYNRAGWYEAGPEPGEKGPAVIAGHVDSTSGPAIFFRLPQLRRGDAIRIKRADGSTVRFEVDRVEQWPKAQFPTKSVYGHTDAPALRLITCSGDFDRATGHYTANTIVYASPR